MATVTDSTKKRKRLTIEDVDISAPVYDPPKHFPVSGLYDPTFVVVDVVDEEASSWTQKFTLPLDLLASSSPYFKSLFEGGFVESERGYVKLHDVSPWIFRVFVGWLYYQNVFYDVEQKKPRRFSPPNIPSMPKSKVKNKRNSKQSAADDDFSELSSSDSSDDDDEDTVRKEERGRPQTILPPFKRQTAQPKPSCHHPPGGSQRKLNQEEDVAYSGNANDDDECNYREPTTRPFDWLFQLYIFGDKYDARDFRVTVFEIIQMKLYQTEPRRYMLPSKHLVTSTVDNLVPSSPLYCLLIDCWATWLGLRAAGPDAEEQAVILMDALPAHFLAWCLVASKRAEHALRCRRCKCRGTGEDCPDTDHSNLDSLTPPEKDVCAYHEHGGDDEEKARCKLRWESRRHQLGRQ